MKHLREIGVLMGNTAAAARTTLPFVWYFSVKDRRIFFTTVLFHWNFSHWKFQLLSLQKASCDRITLNNLRCMLGVLVFL